MSAYVSHGKYKYPFLPLPSFLLRRSCLAQKVVPIFPTAPEGIISPSPRAVTRLRTELVAGNFLSLSIIWRRYHSVMSHPAENGSCWEVC